VRTIEAAQLELRTDLPAPQARPPAEIFYFGGPGAQLWGCLHRARREGHRSCVIVLCPPVAVEYARTYQTCRRWAVRLAHAGFDVLRFDYRGTGDSHGDFRDATMALWLDDIEAAQREASTRAEGPAGVCLMGLGLGASLAALSCRARPVGNSMSDAGLVLWNPVINGQAYLDGLTDAHGKLMRSIRRRWSGLREGATELMGFEYSLELLRELSSLRLCAPPHSCTVRSLLLATNGAGTTPLMEAWSDRASEVDCVALEDVDPLISDPLFGNVPNKAIGAIVQWARKVLP
jgi:uncharacterized protein